jgi:hypothetical protein
MKPAALAGLVAGVFAAGFGAAILLSGSPQAPVVATGPGAVGAQPTAPPAVGFEVQPGSPVAVAPGTDPATTPAAGSNAGSSAGNAPGTLILAPPPPPPPIPPEALAEGERLEREAAAREGPEGDGKVTTLLYEFDDEEDRQAWENKYQKRWETRLQREIDIKVRALRDSIGLQAHQETALRSLLQAEYKERSRLVALLTRKKISRRDFDQAVHANVSTAREALNTTLTQAQLAAYNELKPREQLLRDEIK